MNSSSGRKVGISDIALYIPAPAMKIDTLVEHRVMHEPGLKRHLERAVKVTGQDVIRFPEPWEDTATMAASAVRTMLAADPARDLRRLRHLAVGTETGVDHSKPVSAYVQGMLQRSGVPIPPGVTSFQVQHACAGGTVALMGVAGMLAAGGLPGESGIVVSADIARYETASTAEITQGAGAVAVLVEQDPRLLEIELATAGQHSMDVDDFFRPLGSTTARVNGSYSMRCYVDSLEAAVADHCARRGVPADEALRGTDWFVLHTPFRRMPAEGMEKLLERTMGMDGEAARDFLASKSFDAAYAPLAHIGNLYAGSLTAALAFLLADRFRALGRGIVGKTILLASYGSGSTMVILRARVAEGAPEVIARWDLERVFAAARPATVAEYEAWMKGPVQPELHARLMEHAAIPPGSFALAGIRRDGYRDYEFIEGIAKGTSLGQEREAPGDLHRPVAVPG